MKIVHFDIEADGLDPYSLSYLTCAVTKSADEGLLVWGDKRVEDIVIALRETPKYKHSIQYAGPAAENLCQYLLSHDRITAHNGIGYDWPALQHLFQFPRLREVPSDMLVDTLVLSRMCYPDMYDRDTEAARLPDRLRGRHSLEAWGCRLGVEKGDFDGPWDVPTTEMVEYCIRDVYVLNSLYNKLWTHEANTEAFRVIEHRVAEIIDRQIKTGVCFDVEAAETLAGTLSARKAEIELELQEVFPPRVEEMKTPAYWTTPQLGFDGEPHQYRTKAEAKADGWKDKDIHRGPNKTREIPFNPGSRDQIAERLYELYKWKSPQQTETGKPQITEEVLDALDYPEAKLLSEYFLIDKRLGMVAGGKYAWLNLVDEDGRIHGYVNTLGARTTRMTHNSPNLAQVPSVGAPYGHECRSCFVPRDGWVMVGADAAGLENRCLGHYMAQWDDGEFAEIATTGDIHQSNYEAWEHLNGINSRGDAKAPYYAMMYSAGAEKLGRMIGGTKTDGTKLRKAFFSRYPAYETLLKAVQAKAERAGYVNGPDGRRLTCPSAHSALNTLLQGCGATVMKYALDILVTKLDKKGWVWGEDYEINLNVHDEFQASAPEKHAKTLGTLMVDSIVCAGQALGLKCEMAGEYKIGKSWAETH